MTDIKRRGVIVWVYSLKNLNHLNRFGSVQYISKRMKYVVLYVDETTLEMTLHKLLSLHFVRSVEKSCLPDIELSFDHVLDNLIEKQVEKKA